MKTNMATDRLTRMAESISSNIGSDESRSEYEFSASYGARRQRHLSGLWHVIEHTVSGFPFVDWFADERFGEGNHAREEYEATFQFMKDVCVKRVDIAADVLPEGHTEPIRFEYRLRLAFLYELRDESIAVLPILGYQSLTEAGATPNTRELPAQSEWMAFEARFEDDTLLLVDGTDVKRLGRAKE